jgi:hypothetical protein
MLGLKKASLARLGKSIVFCGLLVVILLAVDFVLRPTTPGVLPWAALADTKHEADVLVLGSSRTHCTVLPMEMWRHAGITAVDVTCGGQPIITTLAYLEQALQSQEPEVVLVEVSLTGMELPYRDMPNAHNNFDYMPVGLPRTEGILRSVSPTAWPEFFFPLQGYHSRWRELTGYDYLPDKRTRYGFARGALYLPEVQPQSGTVSYLGLVEGNYERDLGFIRDMADACARIDARMILFTGPSWNRLKVGDQPLLDRLKRDLEGEYPSLDYLDMNPVLPLVGVDPATDFKDADHVNHRGAVKLSVWLADHLRKQYGVVDHREDEMAARWSEDLRKYDELFVSGW